MTVSQPSTVQYRQWDVPDARAVLLLVHGLGGHTGRWEPLAAFFSSRGIASYAVCVRGFGGTGGIQGHIDSFRAYLRDIETLVTIIRNDYPRQKIFLVGESLGGLIGFHAALDHSGLFNGVVCLSPAFADTLHIGGALFWKIILAAFYKPERQFTMPIALADCSRDDALVKLMDADPREHRFATARLLTEIFIAQQRARIRVRAMSVPVLFLLSGHDTIVSTDASLRIFRALAVRDKSVKVYPEMYHALSIEQGRDAVFGDMLSWIDPRVEEVHV